MSHRIIVDHIGNFYFLLGEILYFFKDVDAQVEFEAYSGKRTQQPK